MTNPSKSMSPEQRTIETLTAFVQDAEHDILSVVTALQAHVDLLHDEQVRNKMNVDRFTALGRAITRLISDTSDLAAISAIAQRPGAKQQLLLEVVMQEIAAETRSAFSKSKVSLAFDIAPGTTLMGDMSSVKTMITRMILSLLHKCRLLETIKVVGLTMDKRVSLSFDIGSTPRKGIFKPWRLGELRLLPTNGDGIGLSTVDAIARLNHGQLSVSTVSDERGGYLLSFKT